MPPSAALLNKLVLPFMPACQMDGCTIIIFIQYSCVLFTLRQYFDFTDLAGPI